MKNNNKIIVKIPSKGEMSFEYLCEKQYEKINSLMHKIEQEFDTSLHDHEEIRHQILDLSNFIRRLPLMVSDVKEIKDTNKKIKKSVDDINEY